MREQIDYESKYHNMRVLCYYWCRECEKARKKVGDLQIKIMELKQRLRVKEDK